MEWKFRPDVPIYTQLMEGFKLSIASGELSPGDKLKPVRDLAAWAGVNPNTMQRALGELEREGLLYTSRTVGRYVTGEHEAVERVKKELAASRVADFLGYMTRLGYSKDEIKAIIEEEYDNART